MTAELKTLVEHCLCRVAAQLAAAAADADRPLMAYVGAGGDKDKKRGGGGSSDGYVHRLLELGLWLSYHSVAEPGMIFTLLEQLMEGAVLSDCQEIFSWVEGQKATLTTVSLSSFQTPGRGFHLLRKICPSTTAAFRKKNGVC